MSNVIAPVSSIETPVPVMLHVTDSSALTEPNDPVAFSSMAVTTDVVVIVGATSSMSVTITVTVWVVPWVPSVAVMITS